MPRRHRVIAAVGLSAFFSVSTVALASNPVRSSSFRGTATGPVAAARAFIAKVPVTFTTSSNGKRLRFVYTDTVCRLAHSNTQAVGTITISGGKFSLRGHQSLAAAKSSKHGAKVLTTTSVAGTFVSPRKVKGTLAFKQVETKAPKASCGTIDLSFTATAR
ncbi:MAG: hypothetical protein ABSH51_24635 [Solirubrobacteraceae bacterium]|jgi:hypothetical protein